MAKPFLKWVGGKSQLLSEVRRFYPRTINKYCEPFVGGGAVLFDVIETFHPQEILINDINPELTNCYNQLKNHVDDMIDLLSRWQNEYDTTPEDERKELYLTKRSSFNDLIQMGVNNVEKAALMIYLNKTCFNGLYRVNAKGLFNVPSGVYRNPTICNEENLRNVSSVLAGVEITTGPYLSTRNFIDENTFVYMDPPYRPLTISSSFTSYTKEGFDDEKQIELGAFVAEIHSIGAKVLLSNSDPKNADENDDFFDELYKEFEIHRVNASRMINCNSSGRGKISELMVACF